MPTISKEILNMMYAKVSELRFGNIVTYWCTEGSKCDTIIFCNVDTGETLQYDRIVKYTTRKNIGFLEFEDKVIILNLETLEEIMVFTDTLYCEYIYDAAVAIPMKDRLVVYSMADNNILLDEECVCTKTWHYNARGRVYDLLGFGETSILVKRDGTVGKVLKTKKNKTYNGATDKGTYCDIVVTYSDGMFSNDDYMDSRNYFVCGSNIYTLEEYLKEITVKSYEVDIKTTEINDLAVESIAGYKVILENGYKGYLSNDLRRLRINGYRGNILDTNFEYYKRAHLQ